MTFDVALDSPWYLLVLLVAPWIWRASRRSLAGLGPTRSWLAVILRTMIVVAIALALSELKTRQADQGVAVVYVLDQSQSIPAPKREAMFEYVVKEVAAHRRDERGDQAGVIVFGRQARVESPVVDQDLAWLTQTAPLAETWSEATDIEAAIRLAATVLPDRGQRRVVLMTDGNETMGNSLPLSQQLAAQGIGMDVVAIEHDGLGNVAVEKVAAPTVARDGMNSEIRVLLRYDPSKVTDSAPETISGKVHVTRRLGDDQHLVAEQDVELAPGLNVLRFVDSGDVPSGFYTYEAHFVGRDFHESTLADNQATAYTHREGQGKVLLIENVDSPGEFDSLASRMREQSLDVEIRRSDAPFQSLADLRSFDCVMLANVARVSVSGNSLFSEFQMEALVRNTEMGSGLILLGGPASFGAGGWANTRLEEASPVNFTIDNAKVAPSGALVLVIDKSGSMSGEKMDMCRRAAIEAVRVLSAKDHVGVVAFDGEPHWIVPMQRIGAQRNAIALRISRLAADGGTDMFPGMQQAVHGLQSVDAAVKHMIVLSDGQTPPAEFDRLSRRMRNAGITVSGVAVGSDAAQSLLAGIAQQGGGEYYAVTSPQAIPRIFVKEAMRVTKPLVYERKEGFVPRIAERHEILTGVNAFPPITGFVMTELKDSPLVEVGLRSPVPDDGANATLLATWQFGLGRVLAITTDAGQRWAADWKGWQHYDSFYERAIRWTMRPDDSRGNFYWNAEFRNGRLQAVVTALNDGEVYLNFLDLNCVVTTPELELMEMPMHQVAPGRYEGALVLDQPGAYQMAIDLGEGRGVLRAGAIAPAGAEFRDQGANVGLLRSLALQRPTGGEPGALVHADQVFASSVGSIAGDGLDTFRPTLASATDFDDAWPQLLLLAAVLFFLDIFVRRVVFDPLEAFAPLNQRLFGRDEATALPDERMERLLRQKEAAAQQGQRHAFELESHRPVEATPDAHPGEASTGTLPPTRPQAAPADAAGGDDSYTSRLFEAKRRARSDRGKQG